MAFYDLTKQERAQLSASIAANIQNELKNGLIKTSLIYFGDSDTYIRKAAYLAIGKIYKEHKDLHSDIFNLLNHFFKEEDFKIRQTVINAAGEIGKTDFKKVKSIFDAGLFDKHHSPRNAVIGSIKKMGEVNPEPVLAWAKTYLQHPDKEIRREICHGIELRGRKHPLDILPLLQELEFDNTKRVRSTLVHVLGQIAYKKGCLEIVINHLKLWKNKDLVTEALEEIIDVHDRYSDFAILSQEEARSYILKNYQ